MARLPIVTWPNPVLRERCNEVEVFDDALGAFIDDLFETMDDADGVGLAANQVADTRRIFVMGIPTEDKDGEQGLEKVALINPEIVARRGELRYEEGCLSFPDVSESVMRAAEIDVRYRDRHGEEQTATLGGLAAVCAQHELDHLDGVTFLDRLSPLKRRIALRSYMRTRRATPEPRRAGAGR